MTVCIAAPCKTPDGGSCIVLSTDMRATSVAGTHDTKMKIRVLAHGWFVMTSGPESEVNSIAKIAERKFLADGAIESETIDATIRSIIFERKTQKADEHLQAKYAMSYANFIDYGKAKLSAEAFSRTEAEIEKLSSRTELIFVGFINGEPEVYKVEENGRSYPIVDFAAIGEGELLATASLYQRTQNDTKLIAETLFNVYEAKKWAEGVPSVGRKTVLGVMIDGRTIEFLSPKHEGVLERELQKVQRGPSPHIDLEKEGFMSLIRDGGK